MRLVCVLLIALLGATACTKKSERLLFNGVYYPTKAKRVKGDREQFVVTVRRADRGVEGARSAGRHGGTNYCLKNYGTSDIDWSDGPDGEDGTLTVSGGSLTFRGKCVLW